MSKKKWNLFNSLALLLVAVTANSACLWYFHQPKFPEEANYLRKHND
ncbi:MAG: cyclic lactone autoinducer peptide [Eubacterium sp.]|nr:cyclic lactone autoinducer peptide [Eubacterium sp.]